MNFRIKIKYRKGEEIKYLSHRDLMRTFIRAIRRAKLPVAYSQGFNPHMKISWGQARKVGQSSPAEYAEINLENHLRPDELLTALNRQLPTGLEILDASLV